VKHTRIFFITIALALVFFGCDSGDAGKKGAASAAPTTSTTVKTKDVKSADVKSATDACADYVKELDACIAKQEGDTKKPWQEELDKHKKAFKDAGASAKTQMEQECITGRAAVKQGCK
jgi:hypothetical protein